MSRQFATGRELSRPSGDQQPRHSFRPRPSTVLLAFCAVLFLLPFSAPRDLSADTQQPDRHIRFIRIGMTPDQVRKASPPLAEAELERVTGPDGRLNALRLRTASGYLGGGFLEAVFTPDGRCFRAVENIRIPRARAPLDPILHGYIRRFGPYDEFRSQRAEGAVTYHLLWNGSPGLTLTLVSGEWVEHFLVLE